MSFQSFKNPFMIKRWNKKKIIKIKIHAKINFNDRKKISKLFEEFQD